MRFKVRKSIRVMLICFITLGVTNTLLQDVHAKGRRYEYRTHRHTRHQRRKLSRRRRIKFHLHKFRWHQRRINYYRKYRLKRRRYRRRTINLTKVRTADPEYHYPSSDLSRMDDVGQMEYQTIKMINVDRASHNLSPLRETVALKKLARKRAHQSAQLDYLTHKDPKGRNYYEQDAKRMKMHLGAYSGENIASAGLGPILMDDNPHVYNNNDGRDMANMDEDEMVYHDSHSHWGHRYNTLNPHYKSIGIGAERKAGTNNYYLAENFSS